MEKVEDGRFLREGKVAKLLLRFAIPCILSMLVGALYNIVDQIFVGNSELGYLGNAATTVVFPLTIIAAAFAWCFGDGTAAYISISQGKNESGQAHRAVGNALVATVVIGLLFVIVGFSFMDQILYGFGASDASIGLARTYFTIILAAMPVYMVANMLGSIIRADGSPAFSMISMCAGAVINMILDPVFIFGFKWGIAGAAWATIIGQFASLIMTVAYLFKTKSFKLKLKSFVPDFKLFGGTVKLGLSTFITQMSIVVISLVCNIVLVKYGAVSAYGTDIPIAVIGIAMKVFTIVISIVVGFVVGAQPILGYNYGARDFKRVRETFKYVAVFTLIVGAVATLLFELCPQAIINIFGKESDLYNEFAVKTFRIFLCLVLVTSAIKVSSVFFQAVGKPARAAVISLSRDIVLFVPLVLLLPLGLGIDGALWAAPIADLAGIVVSATFLARFFGSMKRDGKNVPETSAATIKPSQKGVIVTVSREHGTAGKYIGQLIAQRLSIPYYYKEVIALAAEECGLAEEFLSQMSDQSANYVHDLYLSATPAQYAVSAQDKIIKKIADAGSCVIVGRAANYILREYQDVVRIFIHAPKAYRTQKVMEVYGDTEKDAQKQIERADSARAHYYHAISGEDWGKARQYDLCIDSSIGTEKTAKAICDYLKDR